MTEGIMRPAGGDRLIQGGVDVTSKVTGDENELTSTFVQNSTWLRRGRTRASPLRELFHVLGDAIDLFAFEPADRGVSDWHDWVPRMGMRTTSQNSPNCWNPARETHARADGETSREVRHGAIGRA